MIYATICVLINASSALVRKPSSTKLICLLLESETYLFTANVVFEIRLKYFSRVNRHGHTILSNQFTYSVVWAVKNDILAYSFNISWALFVALRNLLIIVPSH